MLSEDGQGGIALLVTDGKNSPGYDNIFDVLPELLQSKIRVITIALGSTYFHTRTIPIFFFTYLI